MSDESSVWVFHGEGAQIASGVFSDLESAMNWIGKHRLSGTVSRYPLGQGLYDWSIEKEYFEPKRELHRTPAFIQSFTGQGLKHYHIEDGEIA